MLLTFPQGFTLSGLHWISASYAFPFANSGRRVRVLHIPHTTFNALPTCIRAPDVFLLSV